MYAGAPRPAGAPPAGTAAGDADVSSHTPAYSPTSWGNLLLLMRPQPVGLGAAGPLLGVMAQGRHPISTLRLSLGWAAGRGGLGRRAADQQGSVPLARAAELVEPTCWKPTHTHSVEILLSCWESEVPPPGGAPHWWRLARPPASTLFGPVLHRTISPPLVLILHTEESRVLALPAIIDCEVAQPSAQAQRSTQSELFANASGGVVRVFRRRLLRSAGSRSCRAVCSGRPARKRPPFRSIGE